ncbi:DUF3263 domain-containing protein [Streptomyces sp. NPDC018055]|uniref:DUF3263 domain-containing protein n=1 Tax=Streptomyces sp. NPDC018055 TaxID=3365038 RepID=UPI0037B3D774
MSGENTGLNGIVRTVLDNAPRLEGMKPGPRERIIREELGMSPVRFYQILNAAIDTPAAQEYAPVLINRRRRLRAHRRSVRLGGPPWPTPDNTPPSLNRSEQDNRGSEDRIL